MDNSLLDKMLEVTYRGTNKDTHKRSKTMMYALITSYGSDNEDVMIRSSKQELKDFVESKESDIRSGRVGWQDFFDHEGVVMEGGERSYEIWEVDTSYDG